ncbi:hypothetical protein [Kitasatospora sp. LaBMicrA B282]|uniref:hypothetical protein n=1 Tax=Kitasatospora sp. LaBMicrA B282 TaxID=3420949 RepID=UPI003D0B2C2F
MTTTRTARATGRRAARAAALLALLAATVSCSAKTGPHPVSGDEAERLSTVRFASGVAGGAKFSALLSVGAGFQGELTGVLDWKGKAAEATLTSKAARSVGHFTIVWNQQTVALRDLDAQVPQVPQQQIPQQQAGWQQRQLDPAKLVFDRAIRSLLEIPSDRPDNPMLLAADGARWLRRDKVAGTPVDVFRGPGQRSGQQAPAANVAAAPEFWLDDAGHLLRFRAPVDSGTFSADFSDWGTQQIADAAELAGAPTAASPGPSGSPDGSSGGSPSGSPSADSSAAPSGSSSPEPSAP